MSLHGFRAAVAMVKRDEPFYGMIMAAMMKADNDNLHSLKGCWPEVWAELDARYHAPGGLLECEVWAELDASLPEAE